MTRIKEGEDEGTQQAIAEALDRDGKPYRKNGEVRARRVRGATLVETILGDGRKETKNVAARGDYIVTGPRRNTPDPAQIATEAAYGERCRGSWTAQSSSLMAPASSGSRSMRWVHAERLIHKLDTFCEAHVQAKERIRARIWRLYKDLKAYRQAPTARRARQLERRFDAIFSIETGFATLDRLLARLRANKDELLMVLKRPDIPLHTNGSENDIRCQVTRRKISARNRFG